MKNPEPTLLTHEIVCTFPGFTGLTRKGSRPPGLVAASSDELYGPFSEAATRPSPFKIQGFGVWGCRRQGGWQDPESMARQLRLEAAGGIYDVLNRGNYRADVFWGAKTR